MRNTIGIEVDDFCVLSPFGIVPEGGYLYLPVLRFFYINSIVNWLIGNSALVSDKITKFLSFNL